MLKEENPPWNNLLPLFLNLIQTDGYRPTLILSFPVRIIDDEEENSLHPSRVFVQVNDTRSEIYTMTKHPMVYYLHLFVLCYFVMQIYIIDF
jgi:hypothetical protein